MRYTYLLKCFDYGFYDLVQQAGSYQSAKLQPALKLHTSSTQTPSKKNFDALDLKKFSAYNSPTPSPRLLTTSSLEVAGIPVQQKSGETQK